jgi:phosphoribosyl 1,2-cyclic phosphodiesterase
MSCVGYTVEYGDDKFGIATDLGYVDKCAVESLLGCNSVVLESNYDEKMLMNGSYPHDLKLRIKSHTGHLSNYDCAAFARLLAENGTKNFMLGHLSEENNTPDIALNVTSRALKGFDDIVLKVAAVKTPTILI